MMPPTPSGNRRRGGFTLVEIVVAMTVGAMILVGVRQAAVGVADLADATLRRARSLEYEANGERRLRRWVEQMQPDSASTGGLVGDRLRAEFDSWCDVPDGWEERCRVALAIEPDSGARDVRLVAGPNGGPSRALLQGRGPLSLCYLLDASGGGRWREQWDGRLALPLAIAVVDGADTLVVPVGVRE